MSLLWRITSVYSISERGACKDIQLWKMWAYMYGDGNCQCLLFELGTIFLRLVNDMFLRYRSEIVQCSSFVACSIRSRSHVADGRCFEMRKLTSHSQSPSMHCWIFQFNNLKKNGITSITASKKVVYLTLFLFLRCSSLCPYHFHKFLLLFPAISVRSCLLLS